MLSPSKTNTVWLLPDAVSAWASVSNGALAVPALPAALLLTYQTQPAMRDRHAAGVGLLGRPAVLDGVVEEVARVRAARAGAGSYVKSPSASIVTEPPSFVGKAPGVTRQRAGAVDVGVAGQDVAADRLLRVGDRRSAVARVVDDEGRVADRAA